MSEEKQKKYLSKTERTRFDALATHTTVKEAAASIGVAESTLNNWTFKLRGRLTREHGHYNACLSQRSRSPLLKKVLSQRAPLKKMEGDKEGEGEEDE